MISLSIRPDSEIIIDTLVFTVKVVARTGPQSSARAPSRFSAERYTSSYGMDQGEESASLSDREMCVCV